MTEPHERSHHHDTTHTLTRTPERTSTAPTQAHRQRTLLLVDIENLIGSGRFTATDVAAVRDQIDRLTPATAQAIVATSAGRTAVEAGLGWPGARLAWQPGADGADRALIEIATTEHLAARYTHVIICSGDHAFAPVAAALRRQGAHITVVTGAGRLSAALYLAADQARSITAHAAYTEAA